MIDGERPRCPEVVRLSVGSGHWHTDREAGKGRLRAEGAWLVGRTGGIRVLGRILMSDVFCSIHLFVVLVIGTAIHLSNQPT